MSKVTPSTFIFKGLYNWYLQQPVSFFRSKINSGYDFGLLMFIQKYVEFSYTPHIDNSMLMTLTYDYRREEKLTSKTYLKPFNIYFEKVIKSDRRKGIASGYKLKDEYLKEIYQYIYNDFLESKSNLFEFYEINRDKCTKKVLYKTKNGYVDTKKQAQEIEDLNRYSVDTLETKQLWILDKSIKRKPHKTDFHIPKGYQKEKVFINKEHLMNLLATNEVKNSQEAMLYLSILVKHNLFPYVIYKRGDTGRLNSVTRINEKHYPILTNYQGIKKLYRANIFKGFYEYDINTAAPVILSQLYDRTHSKKLKAVNHYIENKTESRKKWAKLLFWEDEKANIKRIKSILTALFFGASLEEDYKLGEHTKRLFMTGKEKEELDKLKESPSFFTLLYEVDKLYSSLAKEYLPIRKGMKSKLVTNEMGISKSFTAKEKNKAIAHIYQGYEVKILLALFDKFKDNVALLLHDAIFTNIKLDIDEIEKIAFDASGFNVKYEEEII